MELVLVISIVLLFHLSTSFSVELVLSNEGTSILVALSPNSQFSKYTEEFVVESISHNAEEVQSKKKPQPSCQRVNAKFPQFEIPITLLPLAQANASCFTCEIVAVSKEDLEHYAETNDLGLTEPNGGSEVTIERIELSSGGFLIRKRIMKRIPLQNLHLIKKYKQFLPLTIDQGQSVYPAFNEAHLARGIPFEVAHRPFQLFCSFQRSGTHVFVRTYENLFSEYFSSVFQNESDTGYEQRGGIMRGDVDTVRAFWLHNFQSYPNYMQNRVQRILFMLREPVERYASFFNYLLSTGNHNFKMEKYYNFYTTPRFQNFVKVFSEFDSNRIMLRWLTTRIPIYYIRYEDMMDNPAELFCDVFSFMNSVPANITDMEAHIRKEIGRNGLVSHYSSIENPKYSPKAKTFESFGKKMVSHVYEKSKEWLEIFGYEKIIQSWLETGQFEQMDNSKDLPFYSRNQETLQNVMLYKSEGPMKNFHLIETHLSPADVLKHMRNRENFRGFEFEYDDRDKREIIREVFMWGSMKLQPKYGLNLLPNA